MEVSNSNFVSNQPQLWQLNDEGHFEETSEMQKCVDVVRSIFM